MLRTLSATRARYFECSRLASSAVRMLRAADAPHDRAYLLAELSELNEEMAALHPSAFGPDPITEESGRDLAESTASSAALLLVLASVENAVSDGRPRRSARADIETAARSILDEMTRTPDLDARLRLMEHLYDALHDVIGGQAVETLWCLPSPRMSGWVTVTEKDAWWAEHGYGRAESFSRRMDAIVERFRRPFRRSA